MGKIYPSVEALIGGTPLLALERLYQSQGLKARVLAKLERSNPGGSAKDRALHWCDAMAQRAMVEDAENRGILKPGATIIEPTSGNTGIGLA